MRNVQAQADVNFDVVSAPGNMLSMLGIKNEKENFMISIYSNNKSLITCCILQNKCTPIHKLAGNNKFETNNGFRTVTFG